MSKEGIDPASRPDRLAEAAAGFPLPSAAPSSNANAFFEPAAIAAARAKLQPQAIPIFNEVIHAIHAALALTLHDLSARPKKRARLSQAVTVEAAS